MVPFGLYLLRLLKSPALMRLRSIATPTFFGNRQRLEGTLPLYFRMGPATGRSSLS